MIGASALRQYGYVHHTEDIDLLLTPEGLEKLHTTLVGRELVPWGAGLRKSLREVEHEVNVIVVTSGEHASSNLAGNPPQAGVGEPRGGDVGARSSGTLLAQYQSLVDWKIQCNWIPPAAAPSSEAAVLVRFRLLRTGDVKDVEIEEGSGRTNVDEPALQAIQRSAPFPSFPTIITEPFLDMKYNFMVERE